MKESQRDTKRISPEYTYILTGRCPPIGIGTPRSVAHHILYVGPYPVLSNLLAVETPRSLEHLIPLCTVPQLSTVFNKIPTTSSNGYIS